MEQEELQLHLHEQVQARDESQEQTDEGTHSHSHDHSHSHSHDHLHSHSHSHSHTHQNTKAVLNRLSRAIGHLESVRKMVEEGRDCSEVLTQLSAVQSALNSTGKVILHDHINHCIVDAVAQGDQQALDELNKAIDQFIK